MLWTVWISPRGEGPTGRGNLFPLPCLSRSRYLTSAGSPTPSAPPWGYPYASRRPPHSTRALAGVPMHSCRQPPPRSCLRQRIPVHFCRQPPPAPSALLPRPHQGAGSVRGDTWWAAVPGSSPAYSRILDRVDIATGGGADGEGELVPPPLSLTLQIPYLRRQPHPVRASVGIPIRFSPAPPLHPRLRRSSPAPTGGGVRAWRYQGSSRVRLFSRISPCCGPWGYRHRGRGRRGGGTCSPSPVFHAPTILLLCRQPSSRPR